MAMRLIDLPHRISSAIIADHYEHALLIRVLSGDIGTDDVPLLRCDDAKDQTAVVRSRRA